MWSNYIMSLSSSLFGPPPRPSQVTQLFGQQLAQPSAPMSGIFNFAAQPAQPASIEWYVRDNCHSKTLGSLKVYLFQKNPDIKFIRTWKDALTQKINQYNQAQYNNTNQGVYVDKTYILGINLCNTNNEHFNKMLEKFGTDNNSKDFCGDEMNGGYLRYTIEHKKRICMFITSEKDGEERLHSVVTFIKDPIKPKCIYIDVLCTCTVPDYVNFKGGYRIMALLYGICKELKYSIRLHSLSAPINFYKSWGFTSTGNRESGLPEFISDCASRANTSLPKAIQTVIAANSLTRAVNATKKAKLEAQSNAKLEAQSNAVNDNNVSIVLDGLDREYSTDSNASMDNSSASMDNSSASMADSNASMDDSSASMADSSALIVENDTAITEHVMHEGKSFNVFDKYVKDGIVKYDLYMDNEDGTMIMRLGIDESKVETMEEYHKRITDKKKSYGTGRMARPGKQIPTIFNEFNKKFSVGYEKYKKKTAANAARAARAATNKMPGGSRRKTKRNSTKRRRTQRRIYTHRK
jgi:hypothetical protein